ncbi:MAG: methionine biosynthesis protein MetW [Alphaproteobacteria bacterium]
MNAAARVEGRSFLARQQNGTTKSVRDDLRIVTDMVAPGSRVLDIGCGDGVLLGHLARAKQVDGRGIEINRGGVNASVANGLPVIQGDADTDLGFYPADSFDYVILSRTLQATRDPRGVLLQLVRIGRRAIVSFPNFGHWRIRLQLLLGGRMPVTGLLDDPWHATPNIHLCTIADFLDLCRELAIGIETAVVLDASGRPITAPVQSRRANLLGEQAIFMLARTAGA